MSEIGENTEVQSDINREVAASRRQTDDEYIAKRRARLERELEQAWVNYREYHNCAEGLEAIGREEEDRNLEVAAFIFEMAEQLARGV